MPDWTIKETKGVSTSGTSHHLIQGVWPIPSLRHLLAVTCSQPIPVVLKVGPDLCSILLVPFWAEGGIWYNPTLKTALSSHLSRNRQH